MTRFIPKEKLSKKARRELDRAGRRTWAFNPASRKVKSKKIYNRKRAQQPEDGGGLFLVGLLGLGQPSATSSTIMSAKPSAAPMVPMLECAPACASGISSSTTT